MTQSFFIPFTLPGLNEQLAGVRRAKWSRYNEEKQKIQRDIMVLIKKAKLKAVVLPVELSFTWREPHKRRDLGNIRTGEKYISDALVAAGIISNDGWKQVRGFHDEFVVNPEAPGVYVTIKEVGAREGPLEAI